MSRYPSKCSNCGSKNLFLYKRTVNAGGGYAPNFLPGLSHTPERFNVVVCGKCGLVKFFARESTIAKLSRAKSWQNIKDV